MNVVTMRCIYVKDVCLPLLQHFEHQILTNTY